MVSHALDHRGDRIRQTGAKGNTGDAEFAGSARIAIGGQYPTRFIRDRNEFTGCMSLKTIHHVQIAISEYAKDDRYAVIGQRTCNSFVEPHGCSSDWVVGL